MVAQLDVLRGLIGLMTLHALSWIMLLFLTSPVSPPTIRSDYSPVFDGTQALVHLTAQCDFGPRPPGSANLSLCREYIVQNVESYGWNVTLQNFTYLGVECVNIVVRWGSADNASILLGAHYDTRPKADQDPDPANRSRPIVGANDGASGAAVLIELSHSIPETARGNIEMVFFDAEDSGNINGWEWIVGSSHYAEQLSTERREAIRAMILLDMVGGTGLRLARETSSTSSLQESVWSLAEQMEFGSTFLNVTGRGIIDDHTPFLNLGIPSLDIIEHNPFPSTWHTLQDTPDKCNATSLETVGRVIESFVVYHGGGDTSFPLDNPVGTYVAVIIGISVLAAAILLLARRRLSR